jgi:hypothetical protein
MVTCESLICEGLGQTMKTLALPGGSLQENAHILPLNDADAEGHDHDVQLFSSPP